MRFFSDLTGSRQCINDIEHFVNRQSTFLSPRLLWIHKISDFDLWFFYFLFFILFFFFFGTCTSITSFCKDWQPHIYLRVIVLWGNGSYRTREHALLKSCDNLQAFSLLLFIRFLAEGKLITESVRAFLCCFWLKN